MQKALRAISQGRHPAIGRPYLPAHSPKDTDGQLAPLIARLGPRPVDCLLDLLSTRLVDSDWLKILVEGDKDDGIPLVSSLMRPTRWVLAASERHRPLISIRSPSYAPVPTAS